MPSLSNESLELARDIICAIFPFLEIAHEDFAASEIVNALEDVHLKATKQHGKNKTFISMYSVRSDRMLCAVFIRTVLERIN